MSNTVTTFTFETEGKKVSSFVKRTLASYKKTRQQLHYAACMAAFLMQEHGQNGPFCALFQGLSINDQTALKAWIAKHAKIEVTDDDGNVTEKPWVAFKKDKLFYPVKGMEEFRKGNMTADEWLATAPFFEKDVTTKANMNLIKLLEYIEKMDKTATKKATDSALDEDPALTEVFKRLHGVSELAKKQREALLAMPAPSPDVVPATIN